LILFRGQRKAYVRPRVPTSRRRQGREAGKLAARVPSILSLAQELAYPAAPPRTR